eukprot:UN29359
MTMGGWRRHLHDPEHQYRHCVNGVCNQIFVDPDETSFVTVNGTEWLTINLKIPLQFDLLTAFLQNGTNTTAYWNNPDYWSWAEDFDLCLGSLTLTIDWNHMLDYNIGNIDCVRGEWSAYYLGLLDI